MRVGVNIIFISYPSAYVVRKRYTWTGKKREDSARENEDGSRGRDERKENIYIHALTEGFF